MIENTNSKQRPYLLAAWPGMGNVAAIAGGYLVRELGLEPMGVVPLIDTFDLNFVGVRSGVVERPHLPRGLLFRTPDDHVGRPLIVFLAEVQPTRQGYAFVHNLLKQLRGEDIERVFTFASLASAIHPSEEPGITAAVTTSNLLEELADFGINPASDGRIGGLNGLMLGAASERELDGACLLAEIPFYAAKVPNYKAARALLSAFGDITGITVDFTELNQRVEAGEQGLLRMLEQIERIQTEQAESESETSTDNFDAAPDGPEDNDSIPDIVTADEEGTSGIDPSVRDEIERLFHDATADRDLAFDLKAELDRLGVFAEYEDRFLDLFRPAD